jgi:hypothetical protein
MAFEAGLFAWPEGWGVVGVVVDIVVTGGAGVLQFLDMEQVWNGNTVRIDFRRSPLHIKYPWMAADAVWIDLVQFRGKPRMLPSAFKRKDVNARHQGVASRMTFGAVDLWMQSRLFPERSLPLPVVTGDTEFLLGRRIGGQGNRRIKT